MVKEIPESGNTDPVGMHTLEVIAHADHFNKWVYSIISPYLKGDVLEIGSGIGNISSLVISNGFTVMLSDYNSSYVELLQKRFSGNKNVKTILSIDLLHPGFENFYSHLKEQSDSIILSNVIEHIADDATALKNCRFLLRPGGHLVVIAPAYQWLYCRLDKQLGHFRRYSLRQMEDLVRGQHFDIAMKRHFNFAGIAGWLVSGKIFRSKMLQEGEMNLFNKIVPVVKWIDQLFLKKAGLSVIVTGIKK